MRTLSYLLAVTSFFHIAALQAQVIQGDNTATYLGDKKWQWSVFIKAPQRILNDIKCVQYTLHPTFADPIKKICEFGEPSQPFAYSAQGWGAFEIPIEITYKDGNVQKLKYQLKFGETAETLDSAIDTPETPAKLDVDNIALEKRRGWWEWTIFVKGEPETVEQIKCVEYTLHETFPNPVREVCERGNGEHPFPLTANGWGAFEIKVRIFLKNGRIQNLKHQLKL